jgi:hypothetical protein
MKSAYELAMERLEKESPTLKLTEEQKTEIAEIDSQVKAKIAEREVFLREQISKAQFSGKAEEADELEQQLARDMRRIQQDGEDKKDKVRKAR